MRIGAFAVSHAAMMEVVLMLSGASAGHTNWIVFVLGNVLVCGLEGLVVGIQVLRLEYYEMFSRFYKGTGRGIHSLSENRKRITIYTIKEDFINVYYHSDLNRCRTCTQHFRPLQRFSYR